MKRAILSVLLLFAFLTGFAQNRNICRLGITYDISQSDHWGKNKPVITSVTVSYTHLRAHETVLDRYFVGRDR